MSAFPSLPLFTDAYLADTRHLTAQEHGAYLLLLMMAWRTPDCRLPDDDAKLAKWASLDARTWKRIKPTVMSFWTPETGTWVQKRLAKEREFVSKRADVARANGATGGRPKILNSNGSDNPAGSTRVTQPKAPNPKPLVIEPIAQRTTAAPREEPMLFDRLLEAAGFAGNPPPWTVNFTSIAGLLSKGYDLDADILPVIRAKARPTVGSWNYFVPAIEQAARDRASIAPKPLAPAEDWPGRLAVYRKDGTWIHSWGPKPGERGCRVPPHLLEIAA